MRGRNKSKLLSLLLYRLPSNYFWPSEQPVSTTIREEEGAGGSAVSTAASPTPSSPASSVQLYSQAEEITTEAGEEEQEGAYLPKSKHAVFQWGVTFWGLSSVRCCDFRPCLPSPPTPQRVYYSSATSAAIEQVFLWQVSWQIFRYKENILSGRHKPLQHHVTKHSKGQIKSEVYSCWFGVKPLPNTQH